MKILLFVAVYVSLAFGAATYAVKPAGTGTLVQGTTPATAWNYDTLALARKDGTIVAGDTIYIWGGNYVLTTPVGDTCLNPGTATGVIAYIGVKAATTNWPPVFSDWVPQADTNAMPKINFTTKRFSFSNYSHIYNMYFYGDTVRGVIFGTNNHGINLAVINAAATASTNYTTYFLGTNNFVGCFFSGANSRGVYNNGGNAYMDGCFLSFPNATNGTGITSVGSLILTDNIFFKCAIAISSATSICRAKNNTFDSCGIDYSATSGASNIFINNIHRFASTNCYKWTTQTPSNIFIRNHIGLNTKAVAWNLVDTTTAFQDHWQTSGDPLITTPGVKYTLEAGSPCIDSGYNTKFGLQ